MIFTVWLSNKIDKYRMRCMKRAVEIYGSFSVIGDKKILPGCEYIDYRDVWSAIYKEYGLRYENVSVNRACDWIRLHILSLYEKSLYFDTDVWFNKKMPFEAGGYNKRDWISLIGNGCECAQFKRTLHYLSVNGSRNVLVNSGRGCVVGLEPFDDKYFYHGAQAYYKVGAEIADLDVCTMRHRFENIEPVYND